MSAGGERSAERSAMSGGDAFDVLKGQHREVESLFKQFQRAENDNECFEVAQLICQKLTVHASIEEEIFYPLARGRGEEGELSDKVLEALEEHLSVKRLIKDIQAAQVGDERLEAKMSVLKEQVSHHVDEEEDELFPQVKKVVSKEERREVGQQLLQRTEQLEGEESEVAMDMDQEGEGADEGQAASANGASDPSRQRSGRQTRGAGSHPHH